MSFAPLAPAVPGYFTWMIRAGVVATLGLCGCYTGTTTVDSDGTPFGGAADDGDPDAPDPAGQTAGDGGDGGGSDGGGSASGGDGGGSDSGGGGTDSGGPGDSGPGPTSDDVPDTPYCQPVADWLDGHAILELEILDIVNEVRSQGANCGAEGSFGPAGPLTMDTSLRCAARVHSLDMADRNFFDHTNPDGQLPWDRMGMAGYNYSRAGENIAAGNSTAQATMNQWMGSDGHCANIMNPDFEHIGVGYAPGGQFGHLWTQVFGAQ